MSPFGDQGIGEERRVEESPIPTTPDRPTYRVALLPAAERQYDKLPHQIIGRVSAAIFQLGRDPRPPGSAALTGTGALRLRVGDYRIVYRVNDDELRVEVLRVAHQREVYRGLGG